MTGYDRNKESSYLQYWDVNNFEWIKDASQFNDDFIKNCNEESDEAYFLKVDVQYSENVHNLHNDLPFLPRRIKIERVENCLLIYIIKRNTLFT